MAKMDIISYGMVSDNARSYLARQLLLAGGVVTPSELREYFMGIDILPLDLDAGFRVHVICDLVLVWQCFGLHDSTLLYIINMDGSSYSMYAFYINSGWLTGEFNMLGDNLNFFASDGVTGSSYSINVGRGSFDDSPFLYSFSINSLQLVLPWCTCAFKDGNLELVQRTHMGDTTLYRGDGYLVLQYGCNKALRFRDINVNGWDMSVDNELECVIFKSRTSGWQVTVETSLRRLLVGYVWR